VTQEVFVASRRDLAPYYAVNPAAIESLRAYFDRFWTRALVAFKREVEAPSRKKKR
jgi:hypothetical protein